MTPKYILNIEYLNISHYGQKFRDLKNKLLTKRPHNSLFELVIGYIYKGLWHRYRESGLTIDARNACKILISEWHFY